MKGARTAVIVGLTSLSTFLAVAVAAAMGGRARNETLTEQARFLCGAPVAAVATTTDRAGTWLAIAGGNQVRVIGGAGPAIEVRELHVPIEPAAFDGRWVLRWADPRNDRFADLYVAPLLSERLLTGGGDPVQPWFRFEHRRDVQVPCEGPPVGADCGEAAMIGQALCQDQALQLQSDHTWRQVTAIAGPNGRSMCLAGCAVQVGDVTGDGCDEILTLSVRTNRESCEWRYNLYRRRGPRFVRAWTHRLVDVAREALAGLPQPPAVLLADLDHDGRHEVICIAPRTGQVRVLRWPSEAKSETTATRRSWEPSGLTCSK